mmetsp:Transcript_55130/g.130014  ORF Transcript_55130/g.130014 Transcript_55130/m.130014 type:complete len:222 (+) Transcript_55130:1088-1753(+)
MACATAGASAWAMATAARESSARRQLRVRAAARSARHASSLHASSHPSKISARSEAPPPEEEAEAEEGGRWAMAAQSAAEPSEPSKVLSATDKRWSPQEGEASAFASEVAPASPRPVSAMSRSSSVEFFVARASARNATPSSVSALRASLSFLRLLFSQRAAAISFAPSAVMLLRSSSNSCSPPLPLSPSLNSFARSSPNSESPNASLFNPEFCDSMSANA